MKKPEPFRHARALTIAMAGVSSVFFAGCNVEVNKTVEVTWTTGGSVAPLFSGVEATPCTVRPGNAGCLLYPLPLVKTNLDRVFGAQPGANFVFEGWSGNCTLWDLNDSGNSCTVAGGSTAKKIKAHFRPANFTGDYTKVDASGAALPADATEWACVIDNKSGLMWEAKTSDGGLHDASWTFSWYARRVNSDLLPEAQAIGILNGGTCAAGSRCDTEDFVRAVKAERLCGGINWRLPTLHELNTLVIPSQIGSSPVADAAFFPDVVGGASFWSTQFRIDGGVNAMASMRHDNGASSFDAVEGGSAVPHAVRLVRKM